MFIVLLRTIILFIVVVFSLRIMGKKQVGQLQPYELVVAIMVSELASLPMQDTRIPLIHGIIPIITLLVIEILISFIELKSQKARSFLDGKPSIVISKGKINTDELKRQLFTVNDLLEELRIGGYFNIEDIEYAILETNGEVSVILKGDTEPVVKKDMKIKSSKKTLPLYIVMEGKVNYQNLSIINKNEKWLNNQLKMNNIKSVKDIFLATMDSENKLFIQTYKDFKKNIGEVDI